MKPIYLIVAICAFLIGCGETPASFKKAEVACAPFGGLKYHWLFPWESWSCVDGTVIKSLPQNRE